ncbi:MAG: PHP domain-containing protein [Victivallaceae bacterium]|nr:PHP domain-containing protein [Victivallaceae bacterium]
MRSAADFHTHSLCSDGAVRPAEIAALAEAKRLAAVALTDHDTVSGIPEFLAEAPRYPELRLIPGVELSSRFNNRELHIVGLEIDVENQEFLDFLEKMRLERVARAEKMALKLAALGLPLPEEDWRPLAVIGRMHFAKLLTKHYPEKFPTPDTVFESLLRRNLPGFVPRVLPHPAEAIALIHRAGGAAVWAHPVFAAAGERAWLKRVLKHLTPAGLDGIEVNYVTFTPEQTALVSEAAEQYNLMRSGGSDFHGVGLPVCEVGTGRGNLNVPADMLAELDKRTAAIRNAK